MTIVLPITGVDKRIPFHVAVRPPEGGLDRPSFIKCEDVRAISTERLRRRLGTVSPASMEQVADLLRTLLDLSLDTYSATPFWATIRVGAPRTNSSPGMPLRAP